MGWGGVGDFHLFFVDSDLFCGSILQAGPSKTGWWALGRKRSGMNGADIVCLSTYLLPICLFMYLSIYPSTTHLSIYLLTSPSICLSISIYIYVYRMSKVLVSQLSAAYKSFNSEWGLKPSQVQGHATQADSGIGQVPTEAKSQDATKCEPSKCS